MAYYDVAMALLVIAGMVWGAWRGITWQLASMASLVAGYSVSHQLSAQLAPHFPGDPAVARILAMLAVYVAVSGGIFVAAWGVRATLRAMQFEAFDRHLGMILGGLEGGLLGLVATLFIVSLAPDTRTPIFSSTSGKAVGKVMAAVGPVLPSEVRTVLAPYWNAAGQGTLATDSGSSPFTRTAQRDSSSDRKKGKSGTDGESSTSIRDLIDKEETRLSKAIVDTAEKELKQTGIGGPNDGNVERR